MTHNHKIFMEKKIKKIPKDLKIESLLLKSNLPILEPEILGFLNELSKKILNTKELKKSPQMVALGFWLRKANINKIIKNNFSINKPNLLKPKGLVFHVAPSNIETMFIYSWVISLICGNKNVVRVSSKNNSNDFKFLFDLLEKLLNDKKWKKIYERNIFISYDHDDEVSAFFTNNCDVRVLWGGNETINKFREFKLQPYASEICFSNKKSFSIINSKDVISLNEEKLKELTAKFVTDAYTFDQMACSSPRLIVWYGENKETKIAKNIFWNKVQQHLNSTNHIFQEGDSFNKCLASNSIAIDLDYAKIIDSDPRFTRLEINKPFIYDTKLYGAGLFLEFSINELNSISEMINRSIQTVSYFANDQKELFKYIENSTYNGIDRLVPIGKSLDFEETWDGINLIKGLTRQITLI